MDKEMIERCTDALDKLQAFDFNNHEREQIILTVLKAMRKPTEKMVEAGSFISTAQSGVYSCDDVWQAMIEAITND